MAHERVVTTAEPLLGALRPQVDRAPGDTTRAWIDRLAATECPAITARRSRRRAEPGGVDPIVWAEARGANVVDVEGNRYVDLSAGFGVAAVGHAHPRVSEAIAAQARTLLHAMGDLFPSRQKIELGERLAALTPGDLQHAILGANGSDAVEAAIKTALVATGKRRVLAFTGSYHGMSLGALGVSGYRDAFRRPFAGFSGATELRLPYPTCGACPIEHAWPGCEHACVRALERALASDVGGSEDVAAVIVEPLQARGGCVAPPPGWLAALRAATERLGVLLIVDEIYTGFGRTGVRFACDREGVVPDLLCVGKAMGGGVPISACVGRASIMERWGEAAGEAIHTSTFLGNPLTCAAALATLDVIETEGLAARAAEVGARWRDELRAALSGNPRVAEVRGEGLLLGVALRRDADGAADPGAGVRAMHGLLRRGYIAAPAGPLGDVLSLTPPLTIDAALLTAATDAIAATV